MPNVISYIHPTRTYLPCTGVGRYTNNILLGIDQHKEINLELLFSKQWLEADRKLPLSCPLRELPARTFSMPENVAERFWKLTGFPPMDRYIPADADWMLSPMETYFPISTCPVAVTIHDVQAFESDLPWSQSRHHRWFRYKWGRWVKRALDHSRIVFTVSEFSKQRIVELLGANSKNIIVTGNGIDHVFSDVATEPTLSTAQPYVLMVGGLRQKKGGDHFIEVAKELRQRRSNIQILIAGASDPVYAKAAEAYPNIKLLGIISDDELAKLMRGSLSLLFLSLYEGFGIPPLEAMAAGVPSIVANRASLPEVVGNAGIVVEPQNVGEIVDAVISLEHDSCLRHHYIDMGKQHVKQHTWESCVQKVVKALEDFS